MGYIAAYMNPFNHMSSAHIKLLPGDLGGGGMFINAGPKPLAFKADKKQSDIEDKEFETLMEKMTEDGRNAKYCNVYTFHGAVWGEFKAFLDRNRFLYMYDYGSVSRAFMMSVAVNWMAYKRQRQDPRVIRTMAAHYIGECVAARCCDTPCKNFGLGLYKMGERAVSLNGGKLDDDYEESWIKNILGPYKDAKDADVVKWIGLVLYEAAMVACDMALRPEDSKPMMDIFPQKYSPETVRCWNNLMSGVPAALVSPNMGVMRKALTKLIVQAPIEAKKISAEKRRKVIERMHDNAVVISTNGKRMSATDIMKFKIISGR